MDWTYRAPHGLMELRPIADYKAMTFKVVKKRPITSLSSALDILEKGHTLTCVTCSCSSLRLDEGRKFKIVDGMMYHHSPHLVQVNPEEWHPDRFHTPRQLMARWFETGHTFEVE